MPSSFSIRFARQHLARELYKSFRVCLSVCPPIGAQQSLSLIYRSAVFMCLLFFYRDASFAFSRRARESIQFLSFRFGQFLFSSLFSLVVRFASQTLRTFYVRKIECEKEQTCKIDCDKRRQFVHTRPENIIKTNSTRAFFPLFDNGRNAEFRLRSHRTT